MRASILLLLAIPGNGLQALQPDEDKPDYMIAYFRHSIKATGNMAFPKWLQGKSSKELLLACPEVVEGDSCLLHMEENFKAFQGQLTGNGKNKCPVAIGKMLRSRSKDLKRNLWTGSYERVLGTGIQTLSGFDGNDGIPQEKMPIADRTNHPEKPETPETADLEMRKITPKEFLLTELGEVKGKRSGWLKEYIFDYSLPANDITPEKCTASGAKGDFSVKHAKDWGKGESGGCELSVYSAKGKQEEKDCITKPSGRDAIEAWSQPMRDIYTRTDFDMIKGLQAIEREGSRFDFLKPDPNNCPTTHSYGYATGVCKVGQHFFNERTSGIKDPDYRQIVRDCHVVLGVPETPEKCNQVIDMLNDLCWPFFTKSHILGHDAHFVDNSAALLLGAIAMRSYRDEKAMQVGGVVGQQYKAMLASAGSTDYPDRDETLVDDLGNLLMSSHDATTNGLRLIMIDAGLNPRPITAWSDGKPMQFQDELSYQVMLAFDLHTASKKIKVQNLVSSLATTMSGCAFDGEPMQELGEWDLHVFLSDMVRFLVERNQDADRLHRMDPVALEFLVKLQRFLAVV